MDLITLIPLLTWPTLLAQIFLIYFFVEIIYFKIKNKYLLPFVWTFIKTYGIYLALLLAFLGMSLSLLLSGYIGLSVCNLCWWQRIFLYPQVFLFGLALFIKDHKVWKYSIVLSLLGGLIAMYHYGVQKFGLPMVACAANSVPCAVDAVNGFGFITIPLMSLTSFLLLLMIAYVSLRE